MNTTSPLSGAGLLDSGAQLASAIESGSWVEGGIAAFSLGLDTAAAAVDPLGSLIAAGLGWLIDHFEPLKGWFDDLTGDAGEVAAFAQTWANIQQQLEASGKELTRILGDVDELAGEAIDAYRRFQTDASSHITGAATWAGAMSTGLSVASTIVQVVHDLVRDVISQLVGSAISWAAEFVFSFGLATPWIISQVSTRVASLAAKVGSKLTDLLKSVKALAGLLEKLRGLLRQAEQLFKKVLPGKAPSEPDGSFYSVAYEMELDPADWARSRSVHFNRANADLDEAMRGDPDFARDMDSMSPGIADRVAREGGRQNPNPDDFIWHHAHPDTVEGRNGVMHLVPTPQHTPGSIFWGTLHPGNKGGFSVWGEKK